MRYLRIILSTVIAVLLAGSEPGTLRAQEMDQQELKAGDIAPDFTIPSTIPVPADGSTVSISAITGQGMAVVIAFFPKAFTGG